MKHLQMEQLHQIQKRAEGNMEQTEIGDIFQVVEKSPPESEGKSSKEMTLTWVLNDSKLKKNLTSYFFNVFFASHASKKCSVGGRQSN